MKYGKCMLNRIYDPALRINVSRIGSKLRIESIPLKQLKPQLNTDKDTDLNPDLHPSLIRVHLWLDCGFVVMLGGVKTKDVLSLA